MISLRPRGGHAALRRAAAVRGAGLVALSPWALADRDDATTRAALGVALSAPRVLVTSPAAARAAARLRPLHRRAGQHWFAVGAGTAAALHRAGVDRVVAPRRMDTEGVLALPGLREFPPGGDAVLGFVTAPGGRGLLLPSLQARGAQVLRVDVYERVPVAPSERSIAALRGVSAPLALALSSGEALQRIVDALPADAAAKLRGAQVLAASERLAVLARDLGFADVLVAGGPRPRDLLAAARVPVALPGA